jgi:hypothetical protein
VSAESVENVLRDLRKFLNDAMATHGFAGAGLQRLLEDLGQLPVASENPDPTIALALGDPNLPEAETYASWKLSEVRQQVSQTGPAYTRLGQQWAVYVYTGWEHEYRPRLAAAHGRAKDQLLYPLLGDLRHLRDDVVHHHGVATPDNAGRCQVLRHWIDVGDPIRLSPDRVAEFSALFPWSDLRSGPGPPASS